MSAEKDLQKIVDDYICEKRAVGHKYIKNEKMLLRLSSLHRQLGYSGPTLPKEFVLAYIEKTCYEQESNRLHRISTIRGLAEYMLRMGYSAYQFPYRAVPYPANTYIPHIFSDKELADFFIQVDLLPSAKEIPFRTIQYSLLFRLLYGSGLRISEALSLNKKDVDLNAGTIFIQNTKLEKKRILPLANSLVIRFREYEKNVQTNSIWQKSDYFFPNSLGNKYSEGTIYWAFRDLLHRSGISHGGRGKGPRLHDLRHTYAVHCLRNWVREGKNLTVALPYLSVYMGHVGPRSTQYYLRLTSELYPDIVLTLDRSYAWIIPGVIIP